MCGIVAWVGGDATPAIEALRHRGPDGGGSFSIDGIFFGHRRLAITGGVNGGQPLISEDGSVVAVVNGEFYGFESQRVWLESRGHRFSTNSDSEILVHLYEESGIEALQTLRGEFAFILYDARTRVLYAARDRVGVKPLVWCMLNGGIALASEAKALFALGHPPRWDDMGLSQVSSHQYTLGETTLFKGVHALRPGHYLRMPLDGSAPRVHRWWTPPFTTPKEAISAQASEILSVLQRAVVDRVRSQENVAVHLSGGIDSALIAGLASAERSIMAWTASFDVFGWDEAALAGEVAVFQSKMGRNCTHHVVPMTRLDLLDALPDAVRAGEGMAINGHLSAKWLLNKRIKESGARVVLSGEGADEIFLGYPHLREDFFSEESDDGALDRLRGANAYLAGHMMPQDDVDGGEWFPAWLRAKMGFGDVLRSMLTGVAQVDMKHAIVGERDGLARVDVAARSWMEPCLSGYILRTLGDGQEMAHGLESRPPFLDHEVMASGLRLPVRDRIRGEVEKAILRDAALGWIPESVRLRRKHPFTAPPLLVDGDSKVRARIEEILWDPSFGRHSPVDRARVLAFLDSPHPSGEPALFAALSLDALGQAFGLS